MSNTAKKEYRELSIDGCESIGRGAHGEVFRLAPDTMVKVYYPGIEVERIQRELDLARKAFVMGVPTAIPFDIVRVGQQYGAVFELLNAVPIRDYIYDDEAHTREFIEKSIKLLKKLHSNMVSPGEIPSMKADTLIWLDEIKNDLNDECFQKVKALVESIPDSLTLLHGDVNPGNFMMADGELMLIDMDTMCTGDPIFELATLFVSYKQFPKINEISVKMFGLTAEKASKMWEKMLKQYMGDVPKEELLLTEKNARTLGCIRVIHYMRKHPELVDQKKAMQICLDDIRLT